MKALSIANLIKVAVIVAAITFATMSTNSSQTQGGTGRAKQSSSSGSFNPPPNH